MDYKVGVFGGFTKTRKRWGQCLGPRWQGQSLLTLPQPFYGPVPGRDYFTLASLMFSISDVSPLEKSSGSIKTSQMSKVKEQSKQTAQAPRFAERNLGLKQKSSLFQSQNHFLCSQRQPANASLLISTPHQKASTQHQDTALP